MINLLQIQGTLSHKGLLTLSLGVTIIMKMTKLLLGVFLGLLAVIHSSPIDSMTQIPAGTEEDVLEEAMTDGFLVGQLFTTEPPKMNTTVQGSQQPSLTDPTEGSGSTAPTTYSPDMSTTIQGSQQPSLADQTEGSGFTTPTTESPETTTNIQTSLQTGFAEGSGLDMITSPITKTPEITTTIFPSAQPTLDNSVEGSGTTDIFLFPKTDSPDASISTSTMQSVQSTTTQEYLQGKRMLVLKEYVNDISSDADSTKGNHLPYGSGETENETMHKGHTTPEWIIIVAFLVGLAALIALCAAIATRDKWNGPDQISVNKTYVLNQKKEVEMQTFLQNEEPKVNGKDSEYTVIPLDDLADHFSAD